MEECTSHQTRTRKTKRKIYTITHEDTGTSLQIDLTWPPDHGHVTLKGLLEEDKQDESHRESNMASARKYVKSNLNNQDLDEDDDDVIPLHGDEEDSNDEDLLGMNRRKHRNCHGQSKRMSFVYDAMDRDEEEDEMDEDEFEDDGFIVDDDDSEENDEVCQICKEGGELMICDGGRNMEGCGKMFHATCVGW